MVKKIFENLKEGGYTVRGFTIEKFDSEIQTVTK